MFGIKESPAVLQQLQTTCRRQQNKPLLSLSIVELPGFLLRQCLPIHRDPGYYGIVGQVLRGSLLYSVFWTSRFKPYTRCCEVLLAVACVSCCMLPSH